MPTYRYRCAKCGEELEQWQSIHDAPLKRHRGGCGGSLHKVLGAPGIVLKGSGFYKTDNRNGSKRHGGAKSEPATDGAAADTSSSSDAASKKDTKSDAKDAKKPAASRSTS